MKKYQFIYPFIALFIVISGCEEEQTEEEPKIDVSNLHLKEEAPFPVGVAVNSVDLFTKEQQRQLVLQEFNSITPEWEFKHQPLTKNGPQQYNWSGTDELVDFAVNNNIRLFGHTLVWEGSLPEWMAEMDSAEFEDHAKSFIESIMTRYEGKVNAYDVVNEAWTVDGIKENTYYEKLGEGYIERMFTYARSIDEDAKLFYNDFNLYSDDEWPEKFQHVLDMIDDFQSRGIPIDGIGFQSHLELNEYSLENFETALQEVVNRGLLVHLSEFDFLMNQVIKSDSLTEAMAEAQGEKIKNIVSSYREIVPQDLQFGITLWGLRDNESWLQPPLTKYPDWPLLFDENYNKKEAYRGFILGANPDLQSK
jgi:endo-1,4-beta-xylanase